jgi:hypothetical protein
MPNAYSIARRSGSGKTPWTSTDVGKSAKWDDLTHQAKSGDYLVRQCDPHWRGSRVGASYDYGQLQWKDPLHCQRQPI